MAPPLIPLIRILTLATLSMPNFSLLPNCRLRAAHGRRLRSLPISGTPSQLIHLHLPPFMSFAAFARVLLLFSFVRIANRSFWDFPTGGSSDAGATALASVALKDSRGAIVKADVDSSAERTAVVALLATPRPRDLIKKIGTRHLSRVIFDAVDRPYLVLITRQFRQTTFEPRRAALPHLERGNASVWSDVLAKSLPFARLASSRPGEFLFAPRRHAHSHSGPSQVHSVVRAPVGYRPGHPK